MSVSPELPLPLRGLPAHSTALEPGEGRRSLSPGVLEGTQLSLSFLFQNCPRTLQDSSARPGGCRVRAQGWAPGLLAVLALPLASGIKGEGSADRIDGDLGLVSSLFGSDMA